MTKHDAQIDAPDDADDADDAPSGAGATAAAGATATDSSARNWRPLGFIERTGAALVAPRPALAEADEPDAAGRAGSDLAALIALVFLATHTREIAYVLWVGAAESIQAGFLGLASALSRAVAMDLAILFVAAIVLTIAAGRRRAMGRDFDLVCVAFIPLLAVRLAAELSQKIIGMTITGAGETVVATLAYSWAGYLLFLGWQTARARSEAS